MLDLIISCVAALLSYFVGSIPFSLILPKLFYKVDVRKIGSGNIGATNVYRACGIKMAIVCFLLDGLKGFVVILFASHFLNFEHYKLYIVAISVILGHVYSLFLQFKGGKGVATSVFVILATDPLMVVVFGICWGLVFYVKKISSLSALISFFALSVISIIFASKIADGANVFYTILFFFVCFTHRQNIKRILNGTEGKIQKSNI